MWYDVKTLEETEWGILMYEILKTKEKLKTTRNRSHWNMAKAGR